MVKTRCGKCRSRVSEKGKLKLLHLLRYEFFTRPACLSGPFLIFGWFINLQLWDLKQDALMAANFKEYDHRTRESLSCWNPDSIGFNLIEHVLCHICRNERPGAVLVFMTGWDDINSLKDQLQAHPLLGDPTRVLLLACHGSMASIEQVIWHLLVLFTCCIVLF